MTGFQVACLQITTSDDMAANIAMVSDMARRARDAGAEFITTPENVSLMDGGAAVRAQAAPEDEHPARLAFAELARETGVWFLAGSIACAAEDGRMANRSLLFDPDGNLVQRYDKMHMFDVRLPDGESYKESRNYRPGGETALAQLPWGVLGMTVCYDMRFPQLYRALAQAGADFLTVPSAFTRVTGRAHWEVLLRARAIETGCFVIAPAQTGVHARERKTYGHSSSSRPGARCCWTRAKRSASSRPRSTAIASPRRGAGWPRCSTTGPSRRRRRSARVRRRNRERSLTVHAGDPLAHRRRRSGVEAVLVGDDVKAGAVEFQQLPGPEQKVRVARPAIVGIARRESFVQQNPAGRQARQIGKRVRAVQIIGDEDRIEGARRERPGASGFEVGLDDVRVRPTFEVREAGGVDVDEGDPMAARQEMPPVAPAARGDVEDTRARHDQRGEATDPGAGLDEGFRHGRIGLFSARFRDITGWLSGSVVRWTVAMILFDLKCSEDHPFEGWFPDSKAFERQRRKGRSSVRSAARPRSRRR